MHFVRDLFLPTPDASLLRLSDILLLGLQLLIPQVSILNALPRAADGQSYDSDTQSLTKKISAQIETGVQSCSLKTPELRMTLSHSYF